MSIPASIAAWLLSDTDCPDCPPPDLILLVQSIPVIPFAGHIPFLALAGLLVFVAVWRAYRTPDGDRPPPLLSKFVIAGAIGSGPFIYNSFVDAVIAAAIRQVSG